jgi:DNA-binding NarL/FixJ family response regulator
MRYLGARLDVLSGAVLVKGIQPARKPATGKTRREREADGSARRRRCHVLLVDSHAILRLGLRSLLNAAPDIEVVAEAGTCDQALGLLASRKIDVLITDLALPGRSGLDLLVEMRERFPQVRTLVLTDHGGYEYAREAFAAGATGYTLKSASQTDLLEAIRAVWAGERHIHATVASRIIVDYLGSVSDPRPPRSLPIVTRRERDVLTRVASGRENRQIAAELGLSVWTVRKHRQNLMRKFALRNAAAITAFAIQNGFVTAEPARVLLNTDPR